MQMSTTKKLLENKSYKSISTNTKAIQLKGLIIQFPKSIIALTSFKCNKSLLSF